MIFSTTLLSLQVTPICNLGKNCNANEVLNVFIILILTSSSLHLEDSSMLED